MPTRRIRRQRKRSMPEEVVYVGRLTPFGNPFRVERLGNASGWLRWYVADPA
ncbi:MAG: DUF4326 domain-containing protein [Micromonosporaceae bacterium]|nr:DUF4326 domain-containing protein [Micromonosporaceae bacterium]